MIIISVIVTSDEFVTFDAFFCSSTHSSPHCKETKLKRFGLVTTKQFSPTKKDEEAGDEEPNPNASDHRNILLRKHLIVLVV